MVREFAGVRRALLEKALGGDTQAIRVWLQEFGSSLVEREKRALESDLVGVSDLELVAAARELVNTLDVLLAQG